MTTRRILVAAAATILLAASISGCAGKSGSDKSGSDKSTPSSSGGAYTVSVQRTGGIAGIRDEVTIGPDGAWRATDRAGAVKTGQLTEEQRATLTRLAGDRRLATESKRVQGPTKCADTYNYVVNVNTMRISYIDCPTDTDLPEATSAIVKFVTDTVWRT